MRNSVLRGLSAASLLILSGCGSLDFFSDDEVPLSGTRVSVGGTDSRNAITADVSGGAVSIPGAQANADWPQLNGNAARSLGHVAAGASLTRAWSVDVGAGSSSSARIVSPPVVAEGRVFTLDAGATVAAHDAGSGTPIWSIDLTPEGENTIDGFGGGVAYDSGRVFVSNGFGDLHAVASSSGEIIWTAALGAPSRAAPAVSAGRIFVVTRDNQIIAVDAGSGEIAWREQGLEQVAGILGGAAPAATKSVVIAPFSSGELNAYSAASGRLGWIDDLTGTRGSTGLAALNDVSGDPVISDGTVYAASQSGRFVAVDVKSGERLWTRNIGGVQPPYVAGDTIFIVSGQGTLVAIEKRSGEILWASELGEYRDPDDRDDPIIWAGPILAGGNLLLASNLGQLVSVNPNSGVIAAQVDLPGATTNAPIAAGGTVYVLTDDAKLAAYR